MMLLVLSPPSDLWAPLGAGTMAVADALSRSTREPS